MSKLILLSQFADREKFLNMRTSTNSYVTNPAFGQEMDLFNPALDQDFLKTFYRRDYEDASFMFGIFLNHTVNSFQEMLAASESSDIEEVKRLAHKLSPTFKSVGLTDMSYTLNAIYQSEYSPEEIQTEVFYLNQELDNILPTVINQMNTLNNYLSSSY